MNSRIIIIAITLLVLYYVYEKISNLENKVSQLENYIINRPKQQVHKQVHKQVPVPNNQQPIPNNQQPIPNNPNQVNEANVQIPIQNEQNIDANVVLNEESISEENVESEIISDSENNNMNINVYQNIENQFAEAVETKYDDSEEKIMNIQPKINSMNLNDKDFNETVNDMLSGMQDFFRDEYPSEANSELNQSETNDTHELQYEEDEENKMQETDENNSEELDNENKEAEQEIITYSNESSNSQASQKNKTETNKSSTSELNSNSESDSSSSSSSSSSSVSTSSRGRKKNPFSKSNLMKKGVADLRKIATDLGIDTEVNDNGKKKNKTKKDLCQEIQNAHQNNPEK